MKYIAMDQVQKELCDSLIGLSFRGKLLRFHQIGPKQCWRPVFDIEHGRVRTILHQLRQSDVGDNVWKGATSEQGGIRFWPAEIRNMNSEDEDEEQRLTIGKVYEMTITNWNVLRESIFKYDTGLAWSVIAQPFCAAR